MPLCRPGAQEALNHNRRMAARLSAFFVWAALAASAVFWGLRLASASPVAPSHTVPVGEATIAHADLSRLLGAEPAPAAAAAPPPESSRFRLVGLAASQKGGAPGVALISIDGKPARAFRVGATVDDPLVLQAVERRAVALGPSGVAPTIRLELPPLPPPSTGSLPAATADGGTPAPRALPPPVTNGRPPGQVEQPQNPMSIRPNGMRPAPQPNPQQQQEPNDQAAQQQPELPPVEAQPPEQMAQPGTGR